MPVFGRLTSSGCVTVLFDKTLSDFSFDFISVDGALSGRFRLMTIDSSDDLVGLLVDDREGPKTFLSFISTIDNSIRSSYLDKVDK